MKYGSLVDSQKYGGGQQIAAAVREPSIHDGATGRYLLTAVAWRGAVPSKLRLAGVLASYPPPWGPDCTVATLYRELNALVLLVSFAVLASRGVLTSLPASAGRIADEARARSKGAASAAAAAPGGVFGAGLRWCREVQRAQSDWHGLLCSVWACRSRRSERGFRPRQGVDRSVRDPMPRSAGRRDHPSQTPLPQNGLPVVGRVVGAPLPG